MKKVAVLQARTNSSRLPAKVLLPIRGIPLSVLAAKRAANTGIDVIVATSEEASDDALASIIAEHGLTCFRGSLDNTLDRVVSALKSYDDQTIVYRLTADNVFPDGPLLDEVAEAMLSENLEYICCNGISSGLPYGVSVEATYLKHLREANQTTTSPFDQEHVTPFIRRKFGESYFDKHQNLNKGHYRCTVDCLDDYLMISEVFSGVANPYDISFLELINKLDGLSYQPNISKPANKMVLGTVQLGLDYGITNKKGKPNLQESTQIIKTAIANGITGIDTARAYGDSEAVIGNSLKDGWQGRVPIITKLSPFQAFDRDTPIEAIVSTVDASIYKSCSDLRQTNLDTVLLHRASHISDWQGAAWDRLLQLKSKGVVHKLGVSVQNVEELELVLNIPDIEHIQMPYNILDWRWDKIIPAIKEIKKSRNLTIHIRSALLQGLLLSDNPELWLKAHITDYIDILTWLNLQAKKYNMSITELCLNFVTALDWIDGVVIGVDNIQQLNDNLRIMSDIRKTMDVHDIFKSPPLISEVSLNPANWKQ